MPDTPPLASPSVALTIAGSDNSAGAGIQADLKTFGAFGVYGLTAVTTVVAEIPGKVKSVETIPLDVLEDQIALSLEAFPVRAAKTGMLWSTEIVTLVHSLLRRKRTEDSTFSLVIDPVMVATSGDPLLKKEAIEAYRELLIPIATIVTPNLDEAQVLLGDRIGSLEELRQAGCELSRRFGVPFLMKGGHLHEAIATDLLIVAGAEVARFEAPYNSSVVTHGTGCTFSAAITASLAKGSDLADSVAAAKEYITRAINQSFNWGEVTALNHFAQARS